MLITDKILVEVFKKYMEYIDVFFKEATIELPEQMAINDHFTDLEKSKQLPYGLIYSLGPVKLEILKTYIKDNLSNGLLGYKSLLIEHLSYLSRKPISS